MNNSTLIATTSSEMNMVTITGLCVFSIGVIFSLYLIFHFLFCKERFDDDDVERIQPSIASKTEIVNDNL